MKKFKLNIDGKEVTGTPGQTILDVARENAIEIPTLCYDERLDIYGSCGLCVVEVQGIPKILKACATEISDNMVVSTKTPRVIESRKTNLELLLSKHIGDCVAPCKRACPGTTDCQGYVGLIANGEFDCSKGTNLPINIRFCFCNSHNTLEFYEFNMKFYLISRNNLFLKFKVIDSNKIGYFPFELRLRQQYNRSSLC